MKNLLFVCLFSMTSLAVFGQGSIVKLGLTNLGYRTINLEYEYALNANSSIQAEVFYKLPSVAPNQATSQFTGNTTDNDITLVSQSLNYSAFGLSYRYYTGGEAPKGFFVSPFLKYGAFKLAMEATFDDVGGSSFDIPAYANATFSTTSFGVDLGYQWILNDKVAINWSFLGLGVTRLGVSGTYETQLTTEFDEWKTDVESFFDDLPFNLRENLPITVDVPNEQMSTSGSLLLPAFRSSISIGYKIN